MPTWAIFLIAAGGSFLVYVLVNVSAHLAANKRAKAQGIEPVLNESLPGFNSIALLITVVLLITAMAYAV